VIDGLCQEALVQDVPTCGFIGVDNRVVINPAGNGRD
jgi:hypothetical protein